jgi:hypothetical protein
VCQHTGPTQAIPADAFTAVSASIPAPIAVPTRALFRSDILFFSAFVSNHVNGGASDAFREHPDVFRSGFQIDRPIWQRIIGHYRRSLRKGFLQNLFDSFPQRFATIAGDSARNGSEREIARAGSSTLFDDLRLGEFPLPVEDFGTRPIEAHKLIPARALAVIVGYGRADISRIPIWICTGSRTDQMLGRIGDLLGAESMAKTIGVLGEDQQGFADLLQACLIPVRPFELPGAFGARGLPATMSSLKARWGDHEEALKGYPQG